MDSNRHSGTPDRRAGGNPAYADWITVKFTDVLDVQGGTQPPKSQFIDVPKEGYIRLLQIRDFGAKPVPTYIPDTSKLKKCEEDDLLIGRYGASLGRICSGMVGAYNVALAKVLSVESLHKPFLKSYLESELFQQPLALLSRSAQNGFNKDDLATFDFVLPPLAEQKVIAEKLDTLLAQVDTTKARLERIPDIIKRFRQSVLAAAVSGRLTEEWRGDNGHSDWKLFKLKDVARVIDPNPSHRYPSADDDGVPILSTQQFSGLSGWTRDKAKLVNREFFIERSKKCGFYQDDIVFARKGRLGLPRFAPSGYDYVFSHTVFIVRANEKISPNFLLWFLRPDTLVDHLLMVMNSNTGVPTLGKATFEDIEVNTPPITEQTEIVRRVEEFFAFADTIEQKATAALERVNNLTQSILAKAFRGELTADWRADNPELISGDNSAEALLAKIQAEREALKPVKKTRKKKAKA